MIKPSLEFFESIPYNDDIEYLKTDDLSYHSNTPYPDNKENIQVETLAKKWLPMRQEIVDFEGPGDLSHFSGIVQEINKNINKNFLSHFGSIIEDQNDSNLPISVLKNLSYDGIRYYCKTDTLVVPQVLLNYIQNSENGIRCKISVYNYKYCRKDLKNILRCKKIKEQKLEFKFIPEKIKYSILEETIYLKDPCNGLFSLYTNLPREYYRKICLDNETLAYNVNKQCFIGHSNCNQTKINHLCYDVAKNGFQKVIQLRLMPDGRLMPYFSNKRVLIAEYLNFPSIPVVIICNSFDYIPENFLYYNSGEVKELADKYLKPYFIV